MGKPWTEALTEGQVKFMNDIVAQIPTDHGARAVFVRIMQKLADAPTPGKFRYVLVKDGDVTGTDDEVLARAFADDEENYVIDVLNMSWLTSAEPDDDTELVEERP